MKVYEKPFGTAKNGSPVSAVILERDCICAEIIDYGAALRRLCVKNGQGAMTDVVLGYDTLGEYESWDGNLGACVGRHANRIGKGEFTLNGQAYSLVCNNGPNHLHGGTVGFDKRVWSHELLADGARFELLSPDGEEGYPGTLSVSVTYRLADDRLDILYEARSDRDTVCNLTNHSYFNLSGRGDVLSHLLAVNADSFTENDENCLPTGRILTVDGTPLDFRRFKPIGRDLFCDDRQLKNCGGYDHNFVLPGSGLRRAAVLYSPDTGLGMEALTTMPGVQVYSANFLSEREGKNGARYDAHSGVCLETQYFPNAMACDNFTKPILRAGQSYSHRTSFRFFAGDACPQTEKYAWKARILPGKLEEYKKRHDEIWPEMLEVLKAAGIGNYSIWNTGDEVFGYYECAFGIEYAARVQAESPVVKRWDACMRDVMRMDTDPVTGAQPLMTQVFDMA